MEVGSLGKTQYDSGSYDVLVELSAGGVSSTTWHHTDYAWDEADVTPDSNEWSQRRGRVGRRFPGDGDV